MARKKILQFSCCAVSVIGILLMTLGIGLPIMIQNQVENTINGLWMKKNQYNSWGVLPGKLGLKVVRSYTLYNVTNPEGVWEGELPELVEIPAFPTEENSVWQDWEYVEKNLTGKGKVSFI